MVAPVLVPAQTAILAQIIQGLGHFPSIVTAHRLDYMGIIHGLGLERLFDRLKAGRATEFLGRAAGHDDLAIPPERPGAIETCFGAETPALQ